MIKVNGKVIIQEHFPDGSLRLEHDSAIITRNLIYHVDWFYDSDAELFSLICLINKIRNYNDSDKQIILYMPYVPHARMDRVHDSRDTFTLKYFSQIINDLKFDEVNITNPHSNVTTALLDRTCVVPTLATLCFSEFQNIEDVVFVYPDEGAAKKFTEIFQHKYAIGMKKRNWEDGKILSWDIVQGQELIAGKDILIIDDICSRGGTFYHAAKRLLELGAKNIYLYVDHCENSILEGDLINSGVIQKVYTTDSIYTGGEHPLIKVVYSYRNTSLN